MGSVVCQIAKLKGCGVSFLDSPTEMIPVALHYLGLPTDSQKKEDIKKAEELFEDGRKLFFLRDADDRVVRIPDAGKVVAVRVVGLRADNVAGPAAITSGGNR